MRNKLYLILLILLTASLINLGYVLWIHNYTKEIYHIPILTGMVLFTELLYIFIDYFKSEPERNEWK